MKSLDCPNPDCLQVNEGITEAEDITKHVRVIGANYWSLWTFHHQKASYLIDYYEQYPKYFDKFARMIGFRIRLSMIWTYEKDGYLGMIVGVANDGIAGVPGILRVTVESPEGKKLASGPTGATCRRVSLGAPARGSMDNSAEKMVITACRLRQDGLCAHRMRPTGGGVSKTME